MAAETETEAWAGAETETATTAVPEALVEVETETGTETATTTETGTVTKTATEAETETKTVTEAVAETETVTSVGAEAAGVAGSEPEPTLSTAVAHPSTAPYLCRNATFGNLTVTVSGSAMRVTGSAERLDLTWVTAQCPQVTSLTVRLKVTGVTGEVPRASRLTELDLSQNSLRTIPESVLRLGGLRRLALAHNKITKLPQDLLETMFHRLDEVDVRGNPLRCSRDLVWLDGLISIQYIDQLTCVGTRPALFGRNDPKPLRQVIAKIQRVNASCPPRCRCKLENFRPTQVVVDCGGAGLPSLPTSLPDRVILLNVSDNQIRSAPLCQLTSVYQRLSTVDLSHNQLTNVSAEDVHCAGQLGRLDLRHNRLARLPWSQLGKELRSGVRLNKVLLSHNPWSCEYKEETMQFWNFLVGHQNAVLDLKRILCSESGTVHAGKEVLTILAEGNLGRQGPYIGRLDIVISIEVLLLLLLAWKFHKDYRAYRLDSTLPWPCRSPYCGQLSD